VESTIEPIRKAINDLAPYVPGVSSGGYRGGICLQQIPSEIANCIAYLKDGDKTVNSYLEVGSAAGGTAYIFDMFFDIDTMVLIDDNCLDASKYRDDILADVDRIEFIGNSQSKEAVEFVENLDQTFDIVFIDADHTFRGASSDVINYSRFVSSGGYLIMHDTAAAPGVKKVFNGIKNSGEFASIIEFVSGGRVLGYGFTPCGIGVIKRHG